MQCPVVMESDLTGSRGWKERKVVKKASHSLELCPEDHPFL